VVMELIEEEDILSVIYFGCCVHKQAHPRRLHEERPPTPQPEQPLFFLHKLINYLSFNFPPNLGYYFKIENKLFAGRENA